MTISIRNYFLTFSKIKFKVYTNGFDLESKFKIGSKTKEILSEPNTKTYIGFIGLGTDLWQGAFQKQSPS